MFKIQKFLKTFIAFLLVSSSFLGFVNLDVKATAPDILLDQPNDLGYVTNNNINLNGQIVTDVHTPQGMQNRIDSESETTCTWDAPASFSPLQLDPNFLKSNGDNYAFQVNKLAIQDDGKIIIGGSFGHYNTSNYNYLARINPDGTLDRTFNTGTGPGPSGSVSIWGIGFQSDGKIIISGSFTSFNGTPINNLARLNTDGSLDTTFNTGTGTNSSIQALKVLNDDKILIGGAFSSYNGVTTTSIARLNSDGTLDTTFNTGAESYSIIYAIEVESDGQILIGGLMMPVIRLNSDGSEDTSLIMGSGYSISTITYSIISQPDGKIIFGGNFTTYNGESKNRIARINPDGSIDNTFNTGSGFDDDIRTLLFQSDGKILIGGKFLSFNGSASGNYMVRLNADGTLDNSFARTSTLVRYVYATAIDNDGKFINVGQISMERLLSNGSIDNTFRIGQGVNGDIGTLAIQSNQKILIGGSFTEYHKTSRARLAQLNTDGTLDTSFDCGNCANNTVYTIETQTDGKILFGGSFTTYNLTSANRIVRVNTNGLIDPSFAIGTGFDSASAIVREIVVQSDGKILVAGKFSSYNGTTVNNFVRLNTDGSLDTSFNIGSGPGGDILSLQVQEDGKILVSGNSIYFNGINTGSLFRLNTDGSIDNLFSSGTGTDFPIGFITLGPNQEIYISGAFSTYNDLQANNVARVHSDGTLDTSFNSGLGTGGTAVGITPQNDGKIIIYGGFSSFNGITAKNLARLNNDGSIDASLNPETILGYAIRGVEIQNDGKIIAVGNFPWFMNDTAFLARLDTQTQTRDFTCTDDVAAASEGNHSITISSLDYLNNIIGTKTVNFSIDRTPPSTPSISDITYDSGNIPTLSWTSSVDLLSGLNNPAYTFEWSQDPIFGSCDSINTNSTFYTFPAPLADGTWYFRVKSTDLVNNASPYSSIYSIEINTNPSPTPTPTPVESPTVTPTLTITPTPNDLPTDPVKIQFYIDLEKENGVEIIWSTDHPVKGYIRYGEIINGQVVFSEFTPIEDSFNLGQRMDFISNLTPGKEYGFEIIVFDEYGIKSTIAGAFNAPIDLEDLEFVDFLGYSKSEDNQITIKYSVLENANCSLVYGKSENNLTLSAYSYNLIGLINESSFKKPDYQNIYFKLNCEDETGKIHEFSSMIKIMESNNMDKNVNENTIIIAKQYFTSFPASNVATMSLVLPIITIFSPTIINVLSLLKYGIFIFSPKRRRRFGLVYDQYTKDPIPFAVIRVFDELNKQIAISVTDRNGKYELDLNLGDYNYEVQHSEYLIIKQRVLAKQEADLILDFPLIHKSKDIVNHKINFHRIISKLLILLTILFFIHAVICFIFNPIAWNLIIVILYFLIFFIKFILSKISRGGIVKDTENNAIKSVYIQLIEPNKALVDKSISNEQGRIKFNVKNGKYLVNVYKEGYSLKNESGSFIYNIYNGRFEKDIILIRN